MIMMMIIVMIIHIYIYIYTYICLSTPYNRYQKSPSVPPYLLFVHGVINII